MPRMTFSGTWSGRFKGYSFAISITASEYARYAQFVCHSNPIFRRLAIRSRAKSVVLFDRILNRELVK